MINNRKMILINKLITILCLFFFIFYHDNIYGREPNIDQNSWPKFSLSFQEIKNFAYVSRKFSSMTGLPESSQLDKMKLANKNALIFPVYNLIRTSRTLSNRIFPDYDYITKNHPEWLLRYKDGSLVMAGLGEVRGPRLDIGNPDYVDWVIKWLANKAETHGYKSISLDNAMFYYANPKVAKYDTPETYQNAWEFFLKKISEALRPHYKIILNVGSTDLPVFARMIKWVDGTSFENIAIAPFQRDFLNIEANRKHILEHLEKGKWCVENGKIWNIRHLGTIKALSLSPQSTNSPMYISIGDQSIIVFTKNQKILGKLNLTDPSNNTLAGLSQSLQKIGLKVNVISPISETTTVNAFQPMTYVQVVDDLIVNLKQAPREAFLFGYATVLMAAGENTYFNFSSEIRHEYYYPEMDLDLGLPISRMYEIDLNVYRRDFENYIVLINLSDKPFKFDKSIKLLPLRGAMIKKN